MEMKVIRRFPTAQVPGLAASHAAWQRAMERPDRLQLLQQARPPPLSRTVSERARPIPAPLSWWQELRPLMLRRTKQTRGADGEPMVGLPPKQVARADSKRNAAYHCLTTTTHAPAWWLLGLRLLLHHLERRLSSWVACPGLGSSPQAAP